MNQYDRPKGITVVITEPPYEKEVVYLHGDMFDWPKPILWAVMDAAERDVINSQESLENYVRAYVKRAHYVYELDESKE